MFKANSSMDFSAQIISFFHGFLNQIINFFRSFSNPKLSIDFFQVYLSALGIGVVVGFVFKRYLRLFITSILISFFILKGLEYQSLIKVDWYSIWEMLGIDSHTSFEEVGIEVYRYFTDQVYVSIVGFIGFLIGYKAG